MRHHITLPDGFGRWVLRRRVAIVISIALLTVLGGWAATRAPLRSSLLEGFMADQSRFLAYRDRAKQFGGTTDEVIFIGTQEGAELFTAAKLDAIRDAARELAEHPHVAHVECLPDAPWLRDRPLGIAEITARRRIGRAILSGDELPELDEYLPPQYWPEYPEEQAELDLAELRETVLRDELIQGVLVSRDGECQGMVVQLRPDANLEGPKQVEMRRDIERIVAAHGLGAEGIHTAGVLIAQGWMLDEGIRSMIVLLPVGALVVSLLIQAIFGRLSLVLLTLLIASVAVVWAVGVTAAVFGELTLFVAGMPLLVLVISTSDTVHLASAFMHEVEAGADRDEALLKVIRDVGGACVLTSVTTFVGFMSLIVVPAATIRHIAVAASVGVAAALLLALTLVPIVLYYAPIRPRRERRSPGIVNRLVDGMIGVCRRAVLARPGWIVLVHAVALGVCGWATTRLKPDADFPSRFLPSHPFRQANDFFQQHLVGPNAIELFVQERGGADPADPLLLHPESLRGLDTLERRLREELPEVEWTLSVASVFRLGGEMLRLGTPDDLPTDPRMAQSLLQLMSATGARPESLILPDRGLTRMVIRVRPTKVFKILDLAERVERLAAETLPAGLEAEASGMYPIIGRAAMTIIFNQLTGFLLCFVTVMTIVGIGVRSVRLALLAIAPNLMPLVVFAGTLGLFVGDVDTDALVIAVIAFGLVVDDTIHFLHRFDIELERSGAVRTAISTTFEYTGAAMVRTTVILGIGLMPFVLSRYLSLRMLGTYLSSVLCWALVGDLLLLPALILLFVRGRRRAADQAHSAAAA